MLQTRQAIVSVLGHVDHGKTTLLDYIRQTNVAKREAGGITQHIGATNFPIESINKICSQVLDISKIKVRGLLFIDTPGHSVFTNLRKRGGSVADIAILVIDINEGLMPQTIEAIEILKQYKVPFIIAANKVDLIKGWRVGAEIKDQNDFTQDIFYKKLYKIVEDLSKYGMDSDLFSHFTASDFKRKIAIIPISAVKGDGIPQLLAILTGLAQKYLEKNLEIDPKSPGKGTILEVMEEVGLGTTINVILYDGCIKKGDSIVVGTRGDPIVTKIKAILIPKPMDEIRDPRHKFTPVDIVYAAAGIKICAPNLDLALPGAPVYVGDEKLIDKVKAEIEKIEFTSDIEGVILKADALGSLEAMITMFTDKKIPIRSADIGTVTKADVMNAEAVREKNKYLGVIFVFHTSMTDEAVNLARDKNIKIFQSDIIYQLIDDYIEWEKQEKQEDMKNLPKPSKIKIMNGFVFRRSDPAIVGVNVLGGVLKSGIRLMNESGDIIGMLERIEKNNEKVNEVEAGEQVAVAIAGPLVGRDINEGDVLYSFFSDEDMNRLKTDELPENILALINEIKKCKKK